MLYLRGIRFMAALLATKTRYKIARPSFTAIRYVLDISRISRTISETRAQRVPPQVIDTSWIEAATFRNTRYYSNWKRQKCPLHLWTPALTPLQDAPNADRLDYCIDKFKEAVCDSIPPDLALFPDRAPAPIRGS
jgi:hypothetical protein